MIAQIIAFSVRNKFLILILTVALVIAGGWAALHSSLDAVPDLSDVQVIVITNYPGQSPQVVDDQVTYPLTTALMGIPNAKVVRGQSMFETSFIYVIFKDGTDLYWARSRVLEYLNFARDRLPAGVEPQLGPDATGVGWVYQYVLYPGYYDAQHPQGLWHDSNENKWYGAPAEAPAERRAFLEKVRAFEQPGVSPLTGQPLLSAGQDISQLRGFQDWYLRYQLTAVPGVSEVASIGGFVKQYQVIVKPERLLAFGLPIGKIQEAIARSNNDAGGSVVEASESEYMVRSRAYLRGVSDLLNVPVGMDKDGTPLLLKDVAQVQIAGEERRGVGELNGQGEAVSGVVIARFGANAYAVISAVKTKLAALESGLPPGVFVKTVYDRSDLIDRSIETLRHTLIEEMIVVGLVCILFLLHARSELVAIFVVPSSVIVSLLAMYALGISANIMSLGGIAIAIGVVVDSAIIMVENAHKHLDQEEERVRIGEKPRQRSAVILHAAQEVGPSLFFSLLIITVSFLPVFILGGEAGRMFRPLALTKTFAMAAAAVLSITIIPVLMVYFISARVLPKRWGWKINLLLTLAAVLFPAAILYLWSLNDAAIFPYRWVLAGGWAVFTTMLLIPQKIVHEKHNPISQILQWLYRPVFRVAIKYRWGVLGVAALFVLSAIWPFRQLGQEARPPLDEGDLLYMPTTDPSIGITTARQILQQTDKLIKTFPEVLSVYGKIGRAETATDPAPLDMLETVVRLKTNPAQWRTRQVNHFFDRWPQWMQWPLLHTLWPAQRRITKDELLYGWTDATGYHRGMDEVVRLPGLGNLWPMPIDNRLKMLATGIKTPVGIKIFGPDLQTLAQLAEKTAAFVQTVPGTRQAKADEAFGGYYLDIDINRTAAARYGLNTADVQDVISSAMGGMNVSTAVEGLERYPINVRYAGDLRQQPEQIKQILIPTPGGMQIPLGNLATVAVHAGPPMIKSENAARESLVWVVTDPQENLATYVPRLQHALDEHVPMPAGYSRTLSGEFEQIQETNAGLAWTVPLTLLLIALLLYAATKSIFRVALVMLAVPFSLVGAVWLLWLLGYHLSGAVWVGMIALAGLDAETGLVMLLYLDNSFTHFVATHRMNNRRDLWEAVQDGAVKRIRPKAMTVAAAFIGLVPLLWATGTGADVMRRLAAPMLGGLATSFLMELTIYPIIFYVAKSMVLRAAWSCGHGQKVLEIAAAIPN